MFLIRNWKYVLTIFGALALISTVFYIRHIQDKIVLAEAELENNRIQQEALKKSLAVKGKNDGKTKTASYNDLIAIHRYGDGTNSWLRND